jgi:hypothetical protein
MQQYFNEFSNAGNPPSACPTKHKQIEPTKADATKKGDAVKRPLFAEQPGYTNKQKGTNTPYLT